MLASIEAEAALTSAVAVPLPRFPDAEQIASAAALAEPTQLQYLQIALTSLVTLSLASVQPIFVLLPAFLEDSLLLKKLDFARLLPMGVQTELICC